MPVVWEKETTEKVRNRTDKSAFMLRMFIIQLRNANIHSNLNFMQNKQQSLVGKKRALVKNIVVLIHNKANVHQKNSISRKLLISVQVVS